VAYAAYHWFIPGFAVSLASKSASLHIKTDFFRPIPAPTYGTMAKIHQLFLRGKGHNMPCLLLTVLLAVATAPLQTQPSSQTTDAATPAKTHAVASAKLERTPTAAGKTSTGAVPSSQAAITIHGLCANTAGKAGPDAACATVVTKAQFDNLINALNAIGPPLLPAQRHVVAEGYAATLLNYEAAKKAGVERDPRFAEVMRLARMRAMGDMYKALAQEKAAKISQEEIRSYYASHTDQLEELTLRRITLPRYDSANLKNEAFAAKAGKLAGEIRERAAKGEDMDALQKEAFDSLGVKNPPSTKMAVIRRGLYSADQEKELFALKPGEVTQVVLQPSALIIFKLESRETPSLDKSKNEIVRILTKQNLEKQEQAQNSSIHIDYNEQYVGPAPNSGWMPASELNGSSKPEASGSNHKPSVPKSESPK
jgi:hypothetical protein